MQSPTFSATKTGQRHSNSPATQLEHFLFDVAKSKRKRKATSEPVTIPTIASESTVLYRTNWSDSGIPSITGSIQPPYQATETVTMNQTSNDQKQKISFGQKLRNLLSPKGFALFKKEMPAAPGFGCENAHTQLPKNLKKQQTKHAAHFSATKKWSKILQKARLSKKHNSCYIQRMSVCFAEDADHCPVRTQKVHRLSALRNLCKFRAFRLQVGCKPVNNDLVNLDPLQELSDEEPGEKLDTGEVTASARDYHTEKLQLSQYRTKLSRELNLTRGETETQYSQPHTNHNIIIDNGWSRHEQIPIPKALRDVFPELGLHLAPIPVSPLISAESTLYSKSIKTISDHGDQVISEIEATITETLHVKQPGQSLTGSSKIGSLATDSAPKTSLIKTPDITLRANPDATSVSHKSIIPFSIETIAPLNIIKKARSRPSLKRWLHKPKSQLWTSLDLQAIVVPQLNKKFELQYLLVDLNFLCKTEKENKLNEYLGYLRLVVSVEKHEETLRFESIHAGANSKPAPSFKGFTSQDLVQPQTPVASRNNHFSRLQEMVRTQDNLMNQCKRKFVAQFDIHERIETYLLSLLEHLQASGEVFVKVCTDIASNENSEDFLADYEHRLSALMEEMESMEKMDLSVKASIDKIKAGFTMSLVNVIRSHNDACDAKEKYQKQFHTVWVHKLGHFPLTQREVEKEIGCASLEHQRDFFNDCLHFKAHEVLMHKMDRLQDLYKKVNNSRTQLQSTFENVTSRFMNQVYQSHGVKRNQQ